MTNFQKNLLFLRERAGLTQEELADKIAVKRQTIWNWEKGLVNRPRQTEIVEALLNFFHVTEDELFGGSDGIYAKAHGLDRPGVPEGAVAVEPPPRAALVPVLGTVHAGDPDLPGPGEEEMLEIPLAVWQNHKSAYLLRVRGGCMSRVYPDGCMVLIDPDQQPVDGSVAVARIDGEDVVRRLKVGSSTLMLVSESWDEDWPDIVVDLDQEPDVAFEGTVVWFQSSAEME